MRRNEYGRSPAGVVAVDGYNNDTPPADDVCPICFGPFEVPCRTSCGHWYCGGCFLKLWRHRGDVNQCNCPMCNSIVNNLAPLSPKLVQPDVGIITKHVKQYFQPDVHKILNQVKEYNRLNHDIPLGFFKKMASRIVENYIAISECVRWSALSLVVVLWIQLILYGKFGCKSCLSYGWLMYVMMPAALCFTACGCLDSYLMVFHPNML